MIGITYKAIAVLEHLIGDVDLCTTDITIGALKIHYISTFPSGEQLIGVGYYYEGADGPIADPEFVFIRSEQGGIQHGKYLEGGSPSPMYYPVSYKSDTFAIDTTCVWFDTDKFNRREQKKIAKLASDWLRHIKGLCCGAKEVI